MLTEISDRNDKIIKIQEVQMEIVVDIRDMLAELVRKLWFIVILVVIGAVALGGFKFYKDSKSAHVGNSATSTAQTKLTSAEKAKVDVYVGMKKQLDDQMEYLDNSIYMSLDPYNFYKTDMQYYINSSDASKGRDLMYAYQYYILKGGLVSDLYQEDDSIKTAYLQEIITVDKVEGTDNLQRNVMNVSIYGKTKEDAENLADRVQKLLEKYQSVVSGSVGAHTLTFVNASTELQSDSNIANTQTNNLNNVLNLEDNADKTKAELSSDQLSIAEKQIQKASEKETKSDLTKDSDSSKKSDTQQETVKVHLSKKYLVVGAGAGFILAIVLILLKYLLSNTMKGAHDLQRMQGLNYLGSVSLKKKNVLDVAANKLFGREPILNEQVEQKLVESKLESCCKNHEISAAALAGNACLKDSKAVSELIAYNADKDLEVVWIGDLAEDPQAIEQLKNYHDIVLVEQLRKSRYESVFYKIKLCEDQGVNILGYIVIA